MNDLSEWSARAAAAALGWPVSHQQFDLYDRWGLLLDPIDERWPRETVTRLVRIREEATAARLMPRRVVRLRADHRLFPIAPPAMRDAFLQLIPTIAQPVRKMARVDRALRAFAAQVQGRPISPRGATLPAPTEWVDLVASLPLPHWDTRMTGWYLFAGGLLPDTLRNSGEGIDDLPLEERVVLYALVDISRSPGAPPTLTAAAKESDRANQPD